MAFRYTLLLLVCSSVAAQDPVGSCEPGTAQAVIETDRLIVPFSTGGALVPTSSTSSAAYTVPKETGISPLFVVQPWISGTVEGEPRVSGTKFSGTVFWPGPLARASDPPQDCSAFDRIWVVSRDDVLEYRRTGRASRDLEDWPADLGAPVIDGDGVPGNYDLEGGDEPDLLGDVAAWWVMNDAGNEKDVGPEPNPPLGVEVRVHAFVFTAPVLTFLLDASFYRLTVVNRRDELIDSLRVSVFADPDLGEFNDDYVGTDTLRHIQYVYNSRDLDGGDGRGYGDAPPAMGLQILRGLEGLPNDRDDDFDGEIDEPGEVQRLTTAPHVLKSRDTSRPNALLSVQRGRISPSEQMYPLDIGLASVEQVEAYGLEPTVWAFPSNPATGEYWTDTDARPDSLDQPNLGFDRRIIATTGPGRLGPGESATIDVAIPYARGRSNLDSVTQLRLVAQALLNAFGEGFPTNPVRAREGEGPPLPEPPPDFAPAVTRVSPNPSLGKASFAVRLPESAPVRAEIYDVLGRRLTTVVDDVVSVGETAFGIPPTLLPGTYLVRVEVGRLPPVALPFTVVR
ncbi:T9SS type A sorting domain-containing protein [Rubrivirga sp.]|uniref:T9SS type A sorting domain-containing protein n=1 Tax=Rubrivirga sp. TaxID=1885344 RepID=UPI003C77792B